MGIFKPNIKKLKTKKDVEGLIKALKYKDSDVRCRAAWALGKIGGKRAVEPLTDALKDEIEYVRMSASEQELLEACVKGNLEDVKRLLEQNIDVNAKNNNGCTVLMITAHEGQTETAKMLIDNGADVNAKSNYGLTALMIAVSFRSYSIENLLRKAGAQE